jgi:hypothetical protein
MSNTKKVYYPKFSWNKVPLYSHFGKNEGELTDEEVNFIVEHFDFLCLEKKHGYGQYGNTEDGTVADVKKIKALNPDLKAIFYLNGFINYRFYKSEDMNMGNNLLLKKNNGELMHKNNTLTYFDLANSETRKRWISFAKKMVLDEGFDGLFIDAVPQVESINAQPEIADSIGLQLGEKRHTQLKEGLYTLFKDLRKEIGDKIILYNGMRSNDEYGLQGTNALPLSDGVTIEHFSILLSKTPDSMASDIEQMSKAGKQGKIVVLKGWPGFCWLDKDMIKKSHDEKCEIARQKLGFQLACFLAGAQEYSYFCYSWGYLAKHGAFEWYDEFDRFIGRPFADAEKHGYTFVREFEGVSIEVNTKTKEYRLDWKK